MGTWDGLVRFDGYEFTHYRKVGQESKSTLTGFVFNILEDRSGILWLSTHNGLLRFDPKTEQFRRYIHDAGDPVTLSNNYLGSALEDPAGNLWVGTRMALEKMDRATGRFQHFPIPLNPADYPESSLDLVSLTERGDYLYFSPHGAGLWRFHKKNEVFERIKSINPNSNSINGLFSDHMGNMFVVDGRISRYDPRQEQFAPIASVEALPRDIFITCLLSLRSGGYLAGTYGDGLIEYDEVFNEVGRYYLDPEPHQYEHNNVKYLLEGKGGEIWIGLENAGLRKYEPVQKQFKVFRHQDRMENTIAGNNIREIYEMADGKIWIATKTEGISIFDPLQQSFSFLRQQPGNPYSLTSPAIRQIFQDSKGKIWIGSWGYGVDVLDSLHRRQLTFTHRPDDPASLSADFITSFCETGHQEIWISTVWGLSVIKTDQVGTGIFKNYRFTKSDSDPAPLRITQVYCDRSGRIWVGSELGGLFLYHPETDSFQQFTNDPNDPNSLAYISVQMIFEDRKNRLWVCAGGLNLYLPERQHFISDIYDKLPNEGVLGITEDAQGKLWLATMAGLTRFDPDLATFRIFDERDGLPGELFLTALPYPGRLDGLIYAGSRDGLVVFHPDSILQNSFLPPVYFTSFRKYQTIGSETVVENLKGLAYQGRVDLSHLENTFTVGFTALNYRNSQKNQFAYKMEGLGDNWIELGSKRELTFSNLSPGAYTLKVKASNNDGVWNEEGNSLKIVIAPPWWRTWWAYLGYLLFMVASVYGIYRFQLNRKLELAEAGRLKELDTLKTRLYTNITHEFRTPLTVIMGMTDNIRGHDQERNLIQRNSKNLLRLINQLLDLSKLDSGSMKMDLVQSDIIQYLKYLTESFYSLAQERKIGLAFVSEPEELVMDFDEVKIQHVVYNLLSNALKFTGEGGKVELHASRTEQNGKPFLKLDVQDTGVGIAREQLPHVFDRFYQADSSHTRKGEGTGIGLTLTKELVELMGGSIAVSSELGAGATFTLLLPVKLELGTPVVPQPIQTSGGLALELVPESAPQPDVHNQDSAREKPILLLIEDNGDVVRYITGLLEKDYAVHTAPNGQAGMEKAFELVPDIIISDVMMPEKDGYEVCETLKNDERTSHIPIILLTAKAEDTDRIAGLRKGADAYLMKPFNKEELSVRLEKLLELRRALQKRYSGSAFLSKEEPEPKEPTLEDIFLQKIRQVIEEKMDDPALGIQELCQAVFLSHTQVFRKLKALTGQNPTLFIRKMRLQKAAVLLKTTQNTISGIAYDVGFTDPNYFSRAFSEEFGVPPSALRN